MKNITCLSLLFLIIGQADGAVYQRNDNGNWDQRNGKDWSQAQQQPGTMNTD